MLQWLDAENFQVHKVQAMVCGHSFLKHLRRYTINNASASPDFNLNQCLIRWHFRGGWTWERFLKEKKGLDHVKKCNIDMLYMEMGSNELDGFYSPVLIAERAIRTADALLDSGVKLVILGEVLDRDKTTSGISVQQYNERARIYNNTLRLHLCDMQQPRNSPARRKRHDLWFWDHEQLHQSVMHLRQPDGVHLTDHPGNYRLYRSIRLALMQGAAHIPY